MRKILLALCLMLLTACGSSANSTDTKPEVTDMARPDVDDKSGTEITPEGDNAMESTAVESEEQKEICLKEVYAEYGLKVGTCLHVGMLKDAQSAKIILDNFNSITMENDMKPDYILDKAKSTESGELVVTFNDNMLTMLDWAKKNDMAVRGHTLIWHSQTPKWLFYENFDTSKSLASREVMLGRMESFIKQVFEKLNEAGYSDIFYAYDVVNEAWLENGSMREDEALWKQTIGDDYLWYAFYYADKYAPENIDLYYNDYNEQYKGDTLVKFVETLVDENGKSLIDGIGLQAHLYTKDDITKYLATIDKLSGTGLKLQITELDVGLGAWQNELPATEENLKAQGQYYYSLLSAFLAKVKAGEVNSDSLTFWGFRDDWSWRKDLSPLLFDSKLKPKYSFYGAALAKDKAGFNR